MNKTKHLHIVVDEKTYDWLKQKSHIYKKTLGQFTRDILEVEMMTQSSYEANLKEHPNNEMLKSLVQYPEK